MNDNLNKNESHSKLTDIKNAVGNKYTEAKDMAANLAKDTSEKAAQVKEYLVEKSHVVKEQAIKAEESVSGYIKENPWKSIGISAAAGIILAKLFSRKK